MYHTLVLDEVKDTYHDVRRLEASIIELHKMFMDLALLVDRQGEMLDQIEYQVNASVRSHRMLPGGKHEYTAGCRRKPVENQRGVGCNADERQGRW